jgi:Spy/CpxP family protein refolding chaperone
MKKVVSTMRMTTTLMATAFLVGVLLAPTAAIAADEPITAAEAKEIAKEAFFWGMHPVAIYHLRYNFAQNELNPRAAGINRLS